MTLIVGGLATIGVLVTWRQKNEADRRSEWWRRTTWAFERTFSSDDTQAALGWKMLKVLGGSTLATKDDAAFVLVIAEHEVLAIEDEPAGQEDDNGGPEESGATEAKTQP